MSLSVSPNPAPVRASPSDVDNFSNTLKCPVTLGPLTDAAMLIPCGHTISKVAADTIYQGIHRNKEGNETVNKQDPCPLCRHTVTAYYPNRVMQSLVSIALNIKLGKVLPLVSAAILDDAEKNLDTIPLPGLGAKFVLTTESWDPFDRDYGNDLVRKLLFKSQTQGSLFEEMEVLGYKDGGVALFLRFKKNSETACNYLSSCGINITNYNRNHGFYRSNPNNNKLLFSIISKHNEIPANKFILIRDLVMSGDWNHVTPLAANERLPVMDVEGTVDTPRSRPRRRLD
jgi:hypothetical protein